MASDMQSDPLISAGDARIVVARLHTASCVHARHPCRVVAATPSAGGGLHNYIYVSTIHDDSRSATREGHVL